MIGRDDGAPPAAAPTDGDHGGDGPRRMLNERQVLAILPISRSTLWRLERAGKFPRSTYVSSNRQFWFADEVTAWQNAINGQRRHGQPKA